MADELPTRPEISPMSDASLAADLLDEIIGSRGVREPVKAMLERAYQMLAMKNTAWTRRRVRAVFHREAAVIQHREIEEMKLVAQARKRHAAHKEETARLVAMALRREADRAGREGEGLGRQSGRVDCA